MLSPLPKREDDSGLVGLSEIDPLLLFGNAFLSWHSRCRVGVEYGRAGVGARNRRPSRE